MNTVLLGLSEVDITPSGPVETIGFGRKDNRSRGVLSPLSAQICVWQSGETRCCLTALDHIGFSKADADFLRDEIGRVLSVKREQVMLCFSHTHSAPNESVETEYFAFVCAQVKVGLQEALFNLSPVLAAWGNARGDIGVNRRSGCEALDDRIGILKVTDADSGVLRLLLLRLTAHANVLKSDNYLISPDYFGTVRDLLREQYGCPVLLTQGASGNVAPKYFCSVLTPPDASDETRFIRSERALDQMAEEIARQAKPVIQSLRPQPVRRLAMYSVEAVLNADVPSEQRALDLAAEARREAGMDGAAWLAEVRRLHLAGVSVQTDTTEIQFFALGNGCLCGVAHELMCEFALRASAILHDNLFYLGGYTNGCTGYFPTEEEYDKGGYEVFWSMLAYFIYHGRVSPLNRDCAEKLLRTVVENAPE